MLRDALRRGPLAQGPFGVEALSYEAVQAVIRDRRYLAPAGLTLAAAGHHRRPSVGSSEQGHPEHRWRGARPLTPVRRPVVHPSHDRAAPGVDALGDDRAARRRAGRRRARHRRAGQVVPDRRDLRAARHTPRRLGEVQRLDRRHLQDLPVQRRERRARHPASVRRGRRLPRRDGRAAPSRAARRPDDRARAGRRRRRSARRGPSCGCSRVRC